MGILINFQTIEKNGWESSLKTMISTVNSIVSSYTVNRNVKITSISNDGSDLQVKWEWAPSSTGYMDYLPERLINGAIELAKSEVSKICIKCGKDKGAPPSLTVKPSMCEECRAKIVPSDYKDNVILSMSGKAGSGKDTVADYLVNNYNFKRMAFADPLRDIVQLLLVMDHDNVWDRKLREKPLKDFPNFMMLEKLISPLISNKTCEESLGKGDYWTVRKLLQFIGTEMFRNMINKDIWVMNFMNRIEPGFNYVASDCRFTNELDLVKMKFGGKVVFAEVTRPGCDGKGIGLANHESEKYKLKSDIVIENNGTLDELYNKVSVVAEDLKIFRI